MKRFAGLVLGLVLLPIAALAQTKPQALLGDWDAALLVTPTTTHRLHLNFATVGGKLTATLVNLDKASAKIPVSAVELTGKEVRLVLPTIKGSFPGELSADGKSLEGYWMEGAHTSALTFKRRVTK